MLMSIERIVEKYLNEEIVSIEKDTVVLEDRKVFEKDLLEEVIDKIKLAINDCLEEDKFRKSARIMEDLIRLYEYYEYEWMA